MPMYFYGTISTIYPNPFTTYNATIDSSFIDITSNLIWWYGLELGDINASNSVYNYISQTYDASAVGFTSMSLSDYRAGVSSLPMSSAQYLSFPNYTFSNSSTYTVSYWVKNSHDVANVIQSIFSPTNNGSTDYTNAFLLQSTNSSSSPGYIYTLNNALNKISFGYPKPLNDNIWHLVTWKFSTNSGTQNLIIDNSSVTLTASGINVSGFNSINNKIGYASWDTANQYITGFVDDCRLYSGSLSSTQIQALWDISNANCYFTSYSIIRSGTLFTINWTGTNIACVTLTNKTQNLNYGRFTTSGIYTGIAWTSNDLFYLTPYNSTTAATSKAGQATRLFNIT